MDNFHYLHLSNRTERLYHQLKERLFTNSHPLTKRVIIVPSAAMKSWLMFQLAQDPSIGISAGIEIGFVEPTINHLFQTLAVENNQFIESYEPSELELSLALEDSIVKIVNTYSSSGSVSAEWLPLLQYLGVAIFEEKKVSKRVLKRICALSRVLAKLFRDYGVYGIEMIAGWQQSPLDWQRVLWQKMELIFANWNYPAKKLESFQVDQSISSQELQVHLFGLSFLAPLHHRFLQKIAAHLPVYYYLLSPCQKFWGDTLSDKESLRLKNYWKLQEANPSSLEALEEFLRDRNPLLANFGRLGREMSIQMESMDAFSSEIYALPASVLQIPVYHELEADDIIMEETPSSLTMLEAVQADIALLRTPQTTNKIVFESYDATIQVHAAPKKMREVQVVYDVLLSILDKHSHEASPILPSDIFVMAPNISEYAPFIRSVFESSESRLEIQLMDLQAPSQHLLIQGFLHLLSLSHGRWQASALLQLFDYPAFRARHRLTGDDVLVIQKWVKETGIYWGKDRHHRNQIFKRDYASFEATDESLIGTWEYGLGRLLEGLAMCAEDPSSEHEMAYSPLDRIEVSQGDLLGIVIHLIRSLQQDLKPLTDGTELSLRDWSAYLTCLFDAYFLPGAEEGEAEGRRILIGIIESFAKASKMLNEFTYSFETIRRHLEDLLKGETATYREGSLHAVRFSSLLPMRAVPAKVIVLMGMGDGLFPRMDQENTLNLLLNDSKADYYPARVDGDRYIFLEAILSARQYFILSYVSQEPGDAKIQAPSLLVKELIGYLDQAYSINDHQELEKPSKFCHYHHALNAFHYSYFSSGSLFKSYSFSSYLAALSHYHIEKKPRQAFLSEFLPSYIEKKDFSHEITIELKELLAFAKSPLKVYLNQVLGIYLDRDPDRIVKDEEDLFLSDLNAALVTKQGLFGSKAVALTQAEKSGQLPQGAFKVVASEKIGNEIDQYSENLKAFEIDLKGIFSIEFIDKYHESQFSVDVWKVPAILLEVPEIGKIKLIGRLDHVCSQGLVQLSQDQTKKVLALWPSCLVLRFLIEKYNLPIAPQIAFIKGKKPKIRKINENTSQMSAEVALVNYLEYYLKAQTRPSPLVPDWIPSIISGESEELKNVFKDDVNEDFLPKFDQYLNWLERNSPNAGLESTAAHWQMTAQGLFVDIFTEGKKKKSVDSLKGTYDSV